jgi:hypothetical protein
MTANNPRNIAASVHQRLLDKARRDGRPFNEMLQYLAMERFLYRLAESPHSASFILKGALMFSAWKVSLPRPTMDIDLLGRASNDLDHIAGIVRQLCLQPVEDDGFVFDPRTVNAARITEDADYEGVRVRFRGRLGNARLAIQIDIGFGDDVVPEPQDIELPSMLDLPVPRLMGYTRESSIAEKFSAMLELGELNSRVKDFFDIWFLSRHFDFDGQALVLAIVNVLSKRAIMLDLPITAFQDGFTKNPVKDSQWKGFLRKSHLDYAPEQFCDVVAMVENFLSPALEAMHNARPFDCFWKAAGPWLPRRHAK